MSTPNGTVTTLNMTSWAIHSTNRVASWLRAGFSEVKVNLQLVKLTLT